MAHSPKNQITISIKSLARYPAPIPPTHPPNPLDRYPPFHQITQLPPPPISSLNTQPSHSSGSFGVGGFGFGLGGLAGAGAGLGGSLGGGEGVGGMGPLGGWVCWCGGF